MKAPVPGLVTAALCGAWWFLYSLGRTAGSSEHERQCRLAGDELVPGPDIVTDHGISIATQPEDVWPWLLQMGWHRGGWYTHRWVDRLLFPQNAPSANAILPQYQALKVGDLVPDGAPETECFFTVRTLNENELMVLQSSSHLPPSLMSSPGVDLNWTWTFSLRPEGYECTRLHFRSRLTLKPWWLRWAYRVLLVPADFVMAGSMCRGIKRRAEELRRVSALPEAAG